MKEWQTASLFYLWSLHLLSWIFIFSPWLFKPQMTKSANSHLVLHSPIYPSLVCEKSNGFFSCEMYSTTILTPTIYFYWSVCTLWKEREGHRAADWKQLNFSCCDDALFGEVNCMPQLLPQNMLCQGYTRRSFRLLEVLRIFEFCFLLVSGHGCCNLETFSHRLWKVYLDRRWIFLRDRESEWARSGRERWKRPSVRSRQWRMECKGWLG